MYAVGPWLPPDASAASQVTRRFESARPGSSGMVPRRYTKKTWLLVIMVSGGIRFVGLKARFGLHRQRGRCDVEEFDAEELLLAGHVTKGSVVVAGNLLSYCCH